MDGEGAQERGRLSCGRDAFFSPEPILRLCCGRDAFFLSRASDDCVAQNFENATAFLFKSVVFLTDLKSIIFSQLQRIFLEPL